MSETPLIEIESLWKGFRRDATGEQRSLAAQLWRAFWGGRAPAKPAPEAQMYWALRGVSAQVRRGRVLGVIGNNGAGKTTLLRVLMAEYGADRGVVTMHGKVCGLIDMLAGFNNALTGRENIYVRGGYLGFSQRELEAIESEIIAFADIGDFIDEPIHTYSQGMRMRLGFAVTTAVRADIMIIDEILAVGDFAFHNKCMAKMNALRPQRATVLCSHALDMIAQLADEVIVLEHGEVLFQGDPIEAVDTYRRLETEKMRANAAAPSTQAAEAASQSRAATPVAPSALPGAEAADAPNQVVAGRAKLLDVPESEALAQGALDPDALPGALRAAMGEFIYQRAAVDDVAHHWIEELGGSARLTLEFTAARPITRLVVGVPVWTSNGVMVTGYGSQNSPLRGNIAAGVRHRVELSVPRTMLNRGVYYPVMAIVDGAEYLYRWPMAPLEILESGAPLVWGLMNTEYKWSQSDVTP